MPGNDPPLISLMVSVDVKQHVYCEHARFCVEVFYALYINFHSFIYLLEVTELRSCVKAEVAVLGSQSLMSRMFFVGVKHRERNKKTEN